MSWPPWQLAHVALSRFPPTSFWRWIELSYSATVLPNGATCLAYAATLPWWQSRQPRPALTCHSFVSGVAVGERVLGVREAEVHVARLAREPGVRRLLHAEDLERLEHAARAELRSGSPGRGRPCSSAARRTCRLGRLPGDALLAGGTCRRTGRRGTSCTSCASASSAGATCGALGPVLGVRGRRQRVGASGAAAARACCGRPRTRPWPACPAGRGAGCGTPSSPSSSGPRCPRRCAGTACGTRCTRTSCGTRG